MKLTNRTRVEKDGALYYTLFPEFGTYSINADNEAVVNADQDFDLYYETADTEPYTVAFVFAGIDGTATIDFLFSADGVNYAVATGSDGNALSIDITDTDDVVNVSFQTVDVGYIKVQYTNGTMTEGTVKTSLKAV